MAEKRMFAKTIIDSDLFLDMPLSTQALYFHLSMRADDDGFVNNPKKIMRMIGASEDDIKILISKQFVLSFESGVIVIRHWKLHNCIQKDRYKPTLCVDEKLLIGENTSKEYLYTGCIQDGNKTETECIQSVYTDKIRLDKIRIDKNRLDKGSEEEDIDIVSDETISSRKKIVRQKHGEYDNVLLSDEEYENLKVEFPEDYQDRIERLSEYMASTGKTYKNHLATIRCWAKKEQPKASSTQSVKQPQSEYDRFMSNLQEIYNESE